MEHPALVGKSLHLRVNRHALYLFRVGARAKLTSGVRRFFNSSCWTKGHDWKILLRLLDTIVLLPMPDFLEWPHYVFFQFLC